MLYIVSTPIGNLADITMRAVKTLKTVSYIAAEDSRRAKILLKKYAISVPILSFHSRSGEPKIKKIINLLKEGRNIALISDAGTPGISDPGYKIIKEALKEKINISPIPGPSAFLAALSVSGLGADKFLYLGFLPVKKKRKRILEYIRDFPYTVVFYESPHRIQKTVNELLYVLGSERDVVIGREITKIYEEFMRGTIKSIAEKISSHPPKGEYVMLIKGNL